MRFVGVKDGFESPRVCGQDQRISNGRKEGSKGLHARVQARQAPFRGGVLHIEEFGERHLTFQSDDRFDEGDGKPDIEEANRPRPRFPTSVYKDLRPSENMI